MRRAAIIAPASLGYVLTASPVESSPFPVDTCVYEDASVPDQETTRATAEANKGG